MATGGLATGKRKAKFVPVKKDTQIYAFWVGEKIEKFGT